MTPSSRREIRQSVIGAFAAAGAALPFAVAYAGLVRTGEPTGIYGIGLIVVAAAVGLATTTYIERPVDDGPFELDPLGLYGATQTVGPDFAVAPFAAVVVTTLVVCCSVPPTSIGRKESTTTITCASGLETFRFNA